MRRAKSRATAAIGTRSLPIAIGKVTLLYGKNLPGLDGDVARETHPAGHVLDPCVVASRLDAGDAQPLVEVYGSVLVVLALVLAPFGSAGRGKLELRDGGMR